MNPRRRLPHSRPALRLIPGAGDRSKARRARVTIEALEARSLLTAGHWLTVLQGQPLMAGLDKQTQYGEALFSQYGVDLVTHVEARDLTGTYELDTAEDVTQPELQAELQQLPGFYFVQEFDPEDEGGDPDERAGADLINFDYLDETYGPFDYQKMLELEQAGKFPYQGGPVTPPPERLDALVNNNSGSTGTANFTQSETSVLAFGGRVLVAYNDSGSNAGGTNKFTGYSYSTDNGNTFTDGGTLPTSTSGDAGDPVLARDETTGTIYFATLSFSGPGDQIFRSTDNGVTWSAPVNGAPGIAAGNGDKEWIAVDNYAGAGRGNLYHVIRDFGAGNGIFFYRSTDGGNTFTPNSGTLIASGNQGAFVTVSPDHAVEAYWYAGTSIMMRKSTDLGVTFGPAITVATGLVGGTNGDLGLTGIRQGTSTASGFRSNEFPHAVVNPVTGAIYVTYNNKGAGTDKADVFFVQSTNGGSTWSTPVKVNDDTTTTDQWQPTLAVTPDGTRLGIFYSSRQEDTAGDNLFKYYGRIGAISGSTVTFAPSFAVSDTASLPEFGRDSVVNSVYMGDYNTASATNGAFYVSWSDNRSDLPGGAPRKDPNVYVKAIPLGLSVTTTVPAVGSVVTTTPTTFTVNVTDPINPGTLQASDFQVNGIPATNVSYTAGTTTIVFTYATTPVTAQGLQTMHIDAGAFTRTSDGGGVIAFDGTFRYDALLLQVTSTAPPPNGVFTLPAPFTYDVTFNEPILPASVTTNSLVVSGLAGATVTAASVLPGNTTARFTIGGVTTEGTLTASIAAGAVTDQFGNPGAAFTANYNVDIGTVAYPTPLASLNPAGSLIYDPTATGIIGPAGDTDGFTLSVDPGQTMTLLVRPTSTTLQPTIQVFDSSNNLIGSASAGAAGAIALIQTVPTVGTTTGTYRFVVGGANGTVGGYTLQVILNAAQEAEGIVPGANNNSIATAQDINGSFTSPGVPGATALRGAVLGTTDPTSYGASGVPFAFENIASTGTVIAGLSGQDDASVSIPIGFNFTFYGQTYTTLFASSNGLITFGSANTEFTNADMTSDPTQAAIAPFWDDMFVTGAADSNVLFQVLGSGSSTRLVIQWNDISFFNDGTRNGGLTFEAVLGLDGSVRFNYLSLATGNNGGANDLGASATVGIKDAGTQGANRLLLVFNNGPTDLVNSTRSVVISPPSQATADYYAFSLNTGETASLVVTALAAGNVNVQLTDGNGLVLVLGTAGSTNLTNAVRNWNVVLNSGTYYARIFGDGNLPYSLVVTRNLAFDSEPNNSAAAAQPLATNGGILGAIAASGVYQATTPSFAFEDISTSGTVIAGLTNQDDTSVSIPIGFSFPFYGQSYTSLFVSSNGLITFGSANTEFTNANMTSDPTQAAIAPFWDDLHTGGGAPDSNVFFQVLGSGSTTRLVIDWNKVRFFSGGTTGDTITFEAVLGLDGSIRFNYADLVSGTAAGNNGASATVGIKDAGTQGANRLLLAFNNGPNAFVGTGQSTLIAAVPGDDWYSVVLTSTSNFLTLQTATPAGGAGEFVNNLTPQIELYNSSGVLVASGTLVADGRNRLIQYLATVPGTYSVRVLATGGTAGEYVLSSQTEGRSPNAALPSSIYGVTIDNGTAQRSRVRSISVDFNGTIATAPTSAFTVVRTQDGLSIPVVASAITLLPNGRSRVTLTFSGSSLEATSLPDGNYTLSIDGSQIFDINGARVDAANNGTAGSTATVSFFRFFGDTNGDGLVDGADLLVFRSFYLSGVATGTNSAFDSDGDGLITIQDYLAFLNNYRRRTLS
jgi:hypothetical protein